MSKLQIARNMRDSAKRIRNKQLKNVAVKCYMAYIADCLIKGRKIFKVNFKGIYMETFETRIADWIMYYRDCIYRLFLISFFPDKDETFERYRLIHSEVLKPVHLRVPLAPNESFLYQYLEKNGFRVKEEHLNYDNTEYVVEIAVS